MKFCFICGKKTEKLIEGYCEDCYNKSFNLIEVPEKIEIFQCKKCDKLRQKNAFADTKVEDLIKSKIKILGKSVKIKINENKIFAKGFLKNSKKAKEETHEINIKIIKTICPECSKRFGGYYESIIQLRGNVFEEILDFIDIQINKRTFYRIETVKEGFNLYIGNKNIANQVAENLNKKYKFKIKKSFKLFTKKEGKDIYKSIFSIRCD